MHAVLALFTLLHSIKMAPPTSQIPNKGKGKALATIHGENNTIRAQSRMEKSAPKQASSDKSGLSKDVQKAVLASPLTIPWQVSFIHPIKYSSYQIYTPL